MKNVARKVVEFERVEPDEVLAGVIQNPQPVCFSRTIDIDAGTSNLIGAGEVVHEMGAPEHMKLYTIMAYVLPLGTPIRANDTINDNGAIAPNDPCWVSGYVDMDLSIFVGNNRVPHRPIDIAVINANDQHAIVLSTPIFCEWSQRMYLQVQNNDPTANGDHGTAPGDPGTVSRVKITLVGEIVDEVELRRRLERQAQAQAQAQARAQQQR